MVSFLIMGHRQVVAVGRKRRWWSQQLRRARVAPRAVLTLIPVLRLSFARRSPEEMRGWGTIAAGDSGDFFLSFFLLTHFFFPRSFSFSLFRVLRQLETRRRRHKLGLPCGSFCKVSLHFCFTFLFFFLFLSFVYIRNFNIIFRPLYTFSYMIILLIISNHLHLPFKWIILNYMELCLCILVPLSSNSFFTDTLKQYHQNVVKNIFVTFFFVSFAESWLNWTSKRLFHKKEKTRKVRWVTTREAGQCG